MNTPSKLLFNLGLMALAATLFVSCKTPAGPQAPLAVTPVLGAVEVQNQASGQWVQVSPTAAGYRVAAPAPTAPATGIPTFALRFSGPASGSDFELKVGNKVAAEGGGLSASTKQQSAETADNPWYYRDGAVAGRIIVRLPNSLLQAGGSAQVSLVNISRNTTATGTDKTSDPLLFTVLVSAPPTVPPTSPPAVPASPSITSITPAVIEPGQPVTINGSNFSPDCATNRVKIDACREIVPTSCSTTAISFIAPDPLPRNIDLQLITGSHRLSRNNITVSRAQGSFGEVTPGRSSSDINQSVPKFSITTTVGVGNRFETRIQEKAVSNPRTQLVVWTVASPSNAYPASNLAGVAVSAGGESALVLSSDPTRVQDGWLTLNVLYTAPCGWQNVTHPVNQFGFRASGVVFIFLAPRFYFSPDGSIVAIVHLASPAVEPPPTQPPAAAILPSNTQVTLLDAATGQILGSDQLQHAGAGFKLEMGRDGSSDAVLVTGERSAFSNQSQISNRKFRL